jgi:hypothetical protein
VALAFGLGVVGSLPFFVVAQVWAYGFAGVAGLLAAWFVADGRRGLIGLLLGVAVPFTAWGGYELFRKVQSCAGGPCSGLSSPDFTLLIAVGLGVLGLAAAGGGYLAGRLLRAFSRRLRPTGS